MLGHVPKSDDVKGPLKGNRLQRAAGDVKAELPPGPLHRQGVRLQTGYLVAFVAGEHQEPALGAAHIKN